VLGQGRMEHGFPRASGLAFPRRGRLGLGRRHGYGQRPPPDRDQRRYRVVSASGLSLAHYVVCDRMGEADARVNLVEQGQAPQAEVAMAFGVDARAVRRDRRRFEAGELAVLGRSAGSPKGTPRLPPSPVKAAGSEAPDLPPVFARPRSSKSHGRSCLGGPRPARRRGAAPPANPSLLGPEGPIPEKVPRE